MNIPLLSAKTRKTFSEASPPFWAGVLPNGSALRAGGAVGHGCLKIPPALAQLDGEYTRIAGNWWFAVVVQNNGMEHAALNRHNRSFVTLQRVEKGRLVNDSERARHNLGKLLLSSIGKRASFKRLNSYGLSNDGLRCLSHRHNARQEYEPC